MIFRVAYAFRGDSAHPAARRAWHIARGKDRLTVAHFDEEALAHAGDGSRRLLEAPLIANRAREAKQAGLAGDV